MNNWGDIIVVAVLVLAVGAAVFKMIYDKRKGKSQCGGDCSNCNNICRK